MNETRLKVDAAFTSFVPEIRVDSTDISSAVLNGATPERYGMKTGMGGDMTALTAPAAAVELVSAENTRPEQPVFLRYTYADGTNGASRLLLHAEKNSTLRVVMQLDSAPHAAGASAVQTRILAEEGARVELYVANLLGDGFLYLNDVGGVTGKDAHIDLLKLELGGKRLFAGTEIGLDGNGSSFDAAVGYHTLGGQTLDMNYNAVHRGKKTETGMDITGSLEDGARKIFRGTIDFRQGSAGAVGTERENVLMLGEDTVNQSVPLILCKEEDVEGNHGASIGQLDEKILFYLSSRGFTGEAARQMIAHSRIQAICNRIPLDEVKQNVETFGTEQA